MQDHVFQLKPSRQYRFLWSLLSLISAGIIISLPLVIREKILLLIALLIYAGCIFWRDGLLKPRHAILQLRRKSDGTWLLVSRQETLEAELLGDSLVTAFVMILSFRTPKRFFGRSCMVFRDSLREDQYRKLLMLLKFA